MQSDPGEDKWLVRSSDGGHEATDAQDLTCETPHFHERLGTSWQARPYPLMLCDFLG